jgi:hypothetical protein
MPKVGRVFRVRIQVEPEPQRGGGRRLGHGPETRASTETAERRRRRDADDVVDLNVAEFVEQVATLENFFSSSSLKIS